MIFNSNFTVINFLIVYWIDHRVYYSIDDRELRAIRYVEVFF